MLTYKIHLIRHGLTQGNLEGRYIGSTDLPLCEAGKAQLLQLREECEYPQVDCVYTSPLQRARQSAEILYPDRQVIPVDGLRELDFGAFENRDMHDLEKDPAVQEWVAAGPAACPPGGESGQMLQKRAIEAVAHIFAQMMEKRIVSAAVVTHGGVIMNLLAAMGLPQRPAVAWQLEPGHGFTCLLSAQMWMRDRKFEVYGQLPYDGRDYQEAFFADLC